MSDSAFLADANKWGTCAHMDEAKANRKHTPRAGPKLAMDYYLFVDGARQVSGARAAVLFFQALAGERHWQG
jgi:hypothetical protein